MLPMVTQAPSGQMTTMTSGIIKEKSLAAFFRAANAPKNQPWFWVATVQAPHLPTERGYAATREDALAAFKRAWLGA